MLELAHAKSHVLRIDPDWLQTEAGQAWLHGQLGLDRPRVLLVTDGVTHDVYGPRNLRLEVVTIPWSIEREESAAIAEYVEQRTKGAYILGGVTTERIEVDAWLERMQRKEIFLALDAISGETPTGDSTGQTSIFAATCATCPSNTPSDPTCDFPQGSGSIT